MAEANGNMEVHCDTKIENNMDTSVKLIDKALLKDVLTHVYRCAIGRTYAHHYVRCIIWNLSNLKCRIQYHEIILGVVWRLTLRKTDTCVIMTIKTLRNYARLEYEICINSGVYVPRQDAKKRDERLYEIIFDWTKATDHEFQIYILGKVSELRSMLYPRERSRRIHEDEMCLYSPKSVRTEYDVMTENLKNIQKRNRFTDFAIHVGNKTIHVHKSLLAARSRFFFDYMHTNCGNGKKGAIEIHVPYEAMAAIVCFLYEGKIKLGSLCDMAHFVALATRLDIVGLKRICLGVFKEFMIAKKADKDIEIFLNNIYRTADMIVVTNMNCN